ncbi:MAG TPA: DEAD/DEAH box helicase, partial [Candidatus Wallbacteria bacterium]|nr:DEAD/DEAH box helicase [Candidatus Wallbacteria bacterium]
MEKTAFEELNISANIKKAVAEMGFSIATPIQATAIPILMDGRDIIAQARTGSGKTAAFAIPIIERIDCAKGLQALVVCPTRELAIQVTEEFRKLFNYYQGLAVVTAYGGQDISIQLRALSQNPQIVVGTPGRLIDHMWRGTIRLDDVNFVVLDEADEMLNMGFRDDIEDILSYVPPKRQTAMFSATMSPDIMRLMKHYQKDPIHVNTTDQKKEIPKIEQAYCELPESRKFEALTGLIDQYDIKISLVFVNTKSKVDQIVNKLNNAGYRAKGIHGGHEQDRREMVMDS